MKCLQVLCITIIFASRLIASDKHSDEKVYDFFMRKYNPGRISYIQANTAFVANPSVLQSSAVAVLNYTNDQRAATAATGNRASVSSTDKLPDAARSGRSSKIQQRYFGSISPLPFLPFLENK